MAYRLSQPTDMDMYKQLIQCTVCPLGMLDGSPGLSGNDLVAHLSKLFSVSPAYEAHLLKKVSHAAITPRDITLRVTVVEAKGIRAMDDNGLSDPYCMLSMLNMQATPESSPVAARKPSMPEAGKKKLSASSLGSKFRRSFRKSFSGLSQNSTRSSTRSLEAFRTKSEKELREDESEAPKDCLRTTTKYETLNPLWNEQFSFKVTDIDKEELHLHLWDSDADETLLKNFKNIDKKCGFKNLLKHIKQTVEHGKMIDDFIGYISIPLKSISALGDGRWYDIYRKYCSKPCQEGQMFLELQYETPPYMARFSEESGKITYRDYIDMCSRLMELEAKDDPLRLNGSKYDGNLSEPSRRVLRLHCIQRGIGLLSQSVSRLIVLLHWAVSGKPFPVSPVALCSAMQEVDETVSLVERSLLPRLLEEHEVASLRAAVEAYTHFSFSHLDDLPQLFPEDSQLKAEFAVKMDSVIRLLQQKFWSSLRVDGFQEVHLSSIRRIAALVTQRIQADVSHWFKSSFVVFADKEGERAVMDELEALVSMLETATAFIQPGQQVYGNIDVNFPKTVILALDRPLSIKTQELLLMLEEYQKNNQRDTARTLEASKVSLRLHMALKSFLKTIKHYFESRHCFKLTLSKFQTWFNSAVVFWLQSFRNECELRTIKALEIDQDFVPVDSLVKFSNSSVDVLACFVKIIQEWTSIDIKNPDLSLMAAIKITDTICDGARLYCNKIECILEKQGFYSDCQVFDITDQHCITLNNLEHIRVYLSKIPSLLNYDELMKDIALHHDEDFVKDRSEDVLHSLLDGAENDLVLKCETLIKRMVDRISCDLANYMNLFLASEDSKPSTMDPLLSYLTSNIKTLKDKLMESLFPLVSTELWNCVLHIFDENLLEGAKPEYYQKMTKFFLILKGHFITVGLAEEDLAFKFPLSLRLRSRLASNSLTSQELIVDCYDMMAKQASDWWLEGGQCVGNLIAKMAYHEDTEGFYTVTVDVIGISYNKNVFDKQQNLSSYVTVELCPTCIFHQSAALKTKVVCDSQRPNFCERFYLEGVTKEAFAQRGSVVAFHVCHHKPFLSDEHIGEAFLELSIAAELREHENNMDTVRPQCIPIRCAKEMCFAPYEILKRRLTWCKDAKLFVSKRNSVIRHQRLTVAAAKAVAMSAADLRTSSRRSPRVHKSSNGSSRSGGVSSSESSFAKCQSECTLVDSCSESHSCSGGQKSEFDETDGHRLLSARSWMRLSRKLVAVRSRVHDSLPVSFKGGSGGVDRRMSNSWTYKSKMKLQRSTSGSSLEITLNNE